MPHVDESFVMRMPTIHLKDKQNTNSDLVHEQNDLVGLKQCCQEFATTTTTTTTMTVKRS
jgi:hypothetical protein